MPRLPNVPLRSRLWVARAWTKYSSCSTRESRASSTIHLWKPYVPATTSGRSLSRYAFTSSARSSGMVLL